MPTILLDLDNTLLTNHMDQFLAAYFVALEQRLAIHLQGRTLRDLMIPPIQMVMRNQDPTITNYDLFMQQFCLAINQSQTVLEPIFEIFYQQDYPSLRQYTAPQAVAPRLVDYLLNQGLTVVIATNPLFPHTAIQQRLEWAEVGHYPYKLVTTMENSIMCKPHEGYYAHILAQIGESPTNAWMIGDDIKNDIEPAQQLGLKTWWITDKPSNSNYQGDLMQFFEFAQTEFQAID